MTTVYRYLSLNIWGNIPSNIQRAISKAYAKVYNRSFSRLIIRPYCKFNHLSDVYLDQFISETGNEYYTSFQDFFTRVYRLQLTVTSDYIWPCEGLFCDYGKVSDLDKINVKGDRKDVRVIFGQSANEIPDHYFFSNVFLHNNNYHRIHCPVDATVAAIEHIPGDLVLLRPWIYKGDPSLPAMRNERVNITLTDQSKNDWYLSIVGGPAVGTIELPKAIALGREVRIGQEIGKFLLGSTLCMAAPAPTSTRLNSMVQVAKPY